MNKLNKVFLALSFTIPLSSVFADPAFTNVSSSAQIQAQLEVNPMSAGIAWIDYDNDGWQYLYVPNSTGHEPYESDLTLIGTTGPNRLYHNNGDGTFTELAASAHAQVIDKPSKGVAVGDYNNDGFDDLFIANAGTNTLLKNNANGTFSDVTAELGLDDVSRASLAASFGDIDGDGDLDIYVGHWTFDLDQGLPFPNNPSNRVNDLYINNGVNGFSNVAGDVGVASNGGVFTVPMTDFDHDQDLDLFVVNDFFAIWLDGGVGQENSTVDSAKNQLYRNDGLDGNGQLIFTEVANLAGLDQKIQGMGIAISDYDNDADLDYYRANYSAGLLSANNGAGVFTTSLISDAATGTVGWGTVFIDVDNDGFVDLYRGNSDSASGNVNADAYQANHFYKNNNGVFTLDTAMQAGLTSIDAGLGVAMADFDKDGDQDIVVHGVDGTVNLLRNDTVTTNTYLQIALKGTVSNKRGIGAKIFVVSGKGANVISTVREVNSGTSHGSTNSLVTHFGLSDAAYVNRVTVEWPSGCVQVLTNISIGFHEIQEDCSPSHVITGRITHNGKGLAGMTVWDAYDYQNRRTVTDASGVFTLSDYAYNQQALIVIPGRDGFLASDSLRYIPSMNGRDVVLADSTASLKSNTISGTVKTAGGVGVADVEIWNVFTYPESVSTDANGVYVLTDVNVGDNFWLNGTRRGMTLVQDSNNGVLSHPGTAVENVDFTITLKPNSVSGFITTDIGVGINANDLWDAATYPSSIVATDVNGFYVISNMTDGNWVVLVPDPRMGFAITPSIDAFIKSPGAAVDHNFTGVAN